MMVHNIRSIWSQRTLHDVRHLANAACTAGSPCSFILEILIMYKIMPRACACSALLTCCRLRSTLAFTFFKSSFCSFLARFLSDFAVLRPMFVLPASTASGNADHCSGCWLYASIQACTEGTCWMFAGSWELKVAKMDSISSTWLRSGLAALSAAVLLCTAATGTGGVPRGMLLAVAALYGPNSTPLPPLAKRRRS